MVELYAVTGTMMAGIAAAAGQLVFALVVLLVGHLLIRWVLKLLAGSKGMEKVDGTVRTFALNAAKMGLYVLLIISVIAIMGVPMASIVTALASAGVAIGLALQGALSNLAGGIMLMIFRPFSQGDWVDAAGVSGTVKEVTLFYTVIVSGDNKRITVPNGTLMNANVVDYSSEEFRRVDLTFACAKSEAPAKVKAIIESALVHERILEEPALPMVRLNGATADGMEFIARVWVKNEDYWDVYFDLTQKITEALAEAGVQAPALRVLTEAK